MVFQASSVVEVTQSEQPCRCSGCSIATHCAKSTKTISHPCFRRSRWFVSACTNPNATTSALKCCKTVKPSASKPTGSRNSKARTNQASRTPSSTSALQCLNPSQTQRPIIVSIRKNANGNCSLSRCQRETDRNKRDQDQVQSQRSGSIHHQQLGDAPTVQEEQLRVRSDEGQYRQAQESDHRLHPLAKTR